MHRRTLAAASTLLSAVLSATALASADAAPTQPGRPTPVARDQGRPYEVTADVSSQAVTVGSKLRIRGSVTPAAPGQRVTLQVKYVGRPWKTIDHTRLSGISRYRFRQRIDTLRMRKYRVVKPASYRHARDAATTGNLTVFDWRPLTSLVPVFAQSFEEVVSVNISATTYPESLAATQPVPATYSIDYDLGRLCTRLEATYGVSDSSPSASSAGLALAVDGVQRYTGTFDPTRAQRVTTDVTGSSRVTLSGTSTGGAVGVVASARVLCSF